MEDIGQIIFLAFIALIAIVRQVTSKANKNINKAVATKNEKGSVTENTPPSTAPKATYESHVFGKYETKHGIRTIDMEPAPPDAYYNPQSGAFNPSSTIQPILPLENNNEGSNSMTPENEREMSRNRNDIRKNFSIRDAVIYSEILKTKF